MKAFRCFHGSQPSGPSGCMSLSRVPQWHDRTMPGTWEVHKLAHGFALNCHAVRLKNTLANLILASFQQAICEKKWKSVENKKRLQHMFQFSHLAHRNRWTSLKSSSEQLMTKQMHCQVGNRWHDHISYSLQPFAAFVSLVLHQPFFQSWFLGWIPWPGGLLHHGMRCHQGLVLPTKGHELITRHKSKQVTQSGNENPGFMARMKTRSRLIWAKDPNTLRNSNSLRPKHWHPHCCRWLSASRWPIHGWWTPAISIQKTMI